MGHSGGLSVYRQELSEEIELLKFLFKLVNPSVSLTLNCHDYLQLAILLLKSLLCSEPLEIILYLLRQCQALPFWMVGRA